MPKVILKSEEFGWEEFEYDTLSEAQQGFARLKATSDIEAAKDGVVRTLLLVVDEHVTDGEDEPDDDGDNII